MIARKYEKCIFSQDWLLRHVSKLCIHYKSLQLTHNSLTTHAQPMYKSPTTHSQVTYKSLTKPVQLNNSKNQHSYLRPYQLPITQQFCMFCCIGVHDMQHLSSSSQYPQQFSHSSPSIWLDCTMPPITPKVNLKLQTVGSCMGIMTSTRLHKGKITKLSKGERTPMSLCNSRYQFKLNYVAPRFVTKK